MPNLLDALTSAVGSLKGASPLELLRGIKKLPAHRWDPVSIDGQHVGVITKHDVGVQSIHDAWAEWSFTLDSDGTAHSFRIDASTVTTAVKVTLDGEEVDQRARLQVRPIVQGFAAKISVRVHFILHGAATEYRFDGTMTP